MRDKTIVVSAFLIAMMLSMTIFSVSAWVYDRTPPAPDDSKFEPWGPRIDRIVVKKYNGVPAMLTALDDGLIDITDWALENTAEVSQYSADTNVIMRGYGGEAGYYEINFNNNPNDHLGNPATGDNMSDVNPVYPNPTSVVGFRQASSYLVNRTHLTVDIGQGLYDPIFVPMPAYMAAYTDSQVVYGGTKQALAYPPSLVSAANAFTAAGFLMGGPGGKRYWDRNHNSAYDAGEEFNLIVYSRSDALRKGGADLLCAGYDDPTIQIPYTRTQITGTQAGDLVMAQKNYNIYTCGWINIGPDPDYLYDLYHSINYYHPGQPSNFGDINDTILDGYLADVKFATTGADAITASHNAEDRFCEIAGEIPLGSVSAPKVYSRYYTGGNDRTIVSPDDGQNQYRGIEWTHVVNQKGFGENSWYTTENAYPKGDYFGDGSMTMYYGWKELAYPFLLNPMYASWYWDWEVLGRMYDSMAGRNPYTLGPFEVDFLAHQWEVGTYTDIEGTKSNVTVHLRNDINWTDGTQFTADDVGYTFVTLPAELAAKGCSAVWYQPTLDQMQSFNKIDDFTIEIKMKVLSVFAIGWVLGNIILPKHVVEPFILDPTVTAAEVQAPWFPLPEPVNHPNLLTSTGPFTLQSDNPATLTMVRNPTAYNRSHRGDLNYDRTVDIFDIVKVATAFGSVPGDPNWDPKADINRDLTVDIFDITIVATAFGWPDPVAMNWPS